MNWYLVKIIFQITCGSGNHKPQFDEQLRLIAAGDAYVAIEKARTLAKAEDEQCRSNEAGIVQWKYIAITAVYPFTSMMDGAELFSTVTEEEHASARIHSFQLKESDLLNQLPVINQLINQ